MNLKVFIQNEAGANVKNWHNEKTLEFLRSELVSRDYPFPYGFVVGTTSEDGLNLDCFVITDRKLKSGEIVECEPIGLMEQVEDGEIDHNVLAQLHDDNQTVTQEVQSNLTNFVCHVFEHVEGKQMRVGRFLGAESARAHVLAHKDGS